MYIVIDVGGTHTRIAVFKDGKTIKKKTRYSTPKGYKDGIETIIKTVKKLSGDLKIESIAIGIPGTIDRKSNTTLVLPHLNSWNDQNVSEDLKEKLKTRVRLANDAEFAALGEAVFGSGKNNRIVGYLTVSTGIGGALVIDKKLVPRAYTSEPGHMMRFFYKSGKGDWEGQGSGLAFEKRYGVAPEDTDDPKLWSQHARILGQGVVSVILLWSPDILVIGGGLSLKGDLLFQPLNQYIKENITVFPPPPVVPAKLGDDAGLYGGLALLTNEKL